MVLHSKQKNCNTRINLRYHANTNKEGQELCACQEARNIYGGTVHNMHMHWKKHETVRLGCDNLPKKKIKEKGEQLERLSGGTVVDIHEAKTIIMWQG